MTVEEILATGTYADKRGRDWASLGEAWVLLDPWRWPNKPKRETITTPEMRLLIRRDMHRDVCLGLYECPSHPVAHVLADGRNEFVSYRAPSRGVVRVWDYEYHTTLPEAMDAAYRLAVGE